MTLDTGEVVPEGYTVYRLLKRTPWAGMQSEKITLKDTDYFLGPLSYTCDDPNDPEVAEGMLTKDFFTQLGVRLVQPLGTRAIAYHFSRKTVYGLTTRQYDATSWIAVHIRFNEPVLRNLGHAGRLWRPVCPAFRLLMWRHQTAGVSEIEWQAGHARHLDQIISELKAGKPPYPASLERYQRERDGAVTSMTRLVNENYRHLVVAIICPAHQTVEALRDAMRAMLVDCPFSHEIISWSCESAVPGPVREALVFSDGEWEPGDSAWRSGMAPSSPSVAGTGATSIMPPTPEHCSAILELYGVTEQHRWGYWNPFAWNSDMAREAKIDRVEATPVGPKAMTPDYDVPGLTAYEMARRTREGMSVYWTSFLQGSARAVTIDFDVKAGTERVAVTAEWLNLHVRWDRVQEAESIGLRPTFRLSGAGVYVDWFFGQALPNTQLDRLHGLSAGLFTGLTISREADGEEPGKIVIQADAATIVADVISTHRLTKLPGAIHPKNGKMSVWLRRSGESLIIMQNWTDSLNWIRNDRMSIWPDSLPAWETTPFTFLSLSSCSRTPDGKSPEPRSDMSTSYDNPSPGSFHPRRRYVLTVEETERLAQSLVALVNAAPRRGPVPKTRPERANLVVGRIARLISMKAEFDLTLRELASLVGDTDTKQVKFILAKIVATGVIEQIDLSAEVVPAPGGRHRIQVAQAYEVTGRKPPMRFKVRPDRVQALLGNAAEPIVTGDAPQPKLALHPPCSAARG